MAEIKAGWLNDYDGNRFVPKTVIDEVLNANGTQILSTGTLGSNNRFIYFNNGVFAVANTTIGSSSQPVYYNGTLGFTAIAAAGGANNPVYIGTNGFIEGNSTLYNLDTSYTQSTKTMTISLTRGGSDHDSINLIAGSEINFTRDATTGAVTINSYDYYLDPAITAGALCLATGQGGLTSDLYAPQMSSTQFGVAKTYRDSEYDSDTIITGQNYGVSVTTDGVLFVSVPWHTGSNNYHEAKYSSGVAITEDSVSLDELYVPFTSANSYGIIKETDIVSNMQLSDLDANGYRGLKVTSDGYGYVYAPDTDTWNANAVGVAGYVAAPTTSTILRVWKTDASGNPGWRQDADTQYYFCVADGKMGASDVATSNPYVELWTDSDEFTDSFQLVGGTNVTISSDANRVITISATDSKVIQNQETGSGTYPILTRWNNTTSGSANAAGYSPNCYIDHANATIYANTFWGHVEAQGATPVTTDTYDLGSSSFRWNEAWIKTLNFATDYYITYDDDARYETIDIYPNLYVGGTAEIDDTLTVNANADINGVVTAASFNAYSDIRLKENFRPFTHGDILNLPLYIFDYIDGAKNKVGCIAQDLQLICPEIVHEDKNGYLSIEENKIVYLLLEEIKKLNEGFQKLQKENEILKQKIKNLEG